MAKSELKIAGMKLMIDGGARFQSDLNAANQTSKALKAELKLLEAGTTSAGKNGLEYLRTKSEALSAQLTKQEQITKINKIAMDEAANATEVDAKQVQRLENQVLKSQIAEQKLKVELQEVSAQMGRATNQALQHGLAQKKMGEEAQASGKKLEGVGNNLTKYVTTPAIAAGVALAALMVKSVDSADGIKKMSDVTGLSTDRIQELTYAGKDLDVELEVITKSMAKNIKSQKAAQDGTSLTVDAYKKLGVEYQNADGSLRDSDDTYWDVIESLSTMRNETERDGLAMQLLGKSAMELNPLIKAGSARIAELSEEARKNGAVMSEAKVNGLDAFGDSVEKTKVIVGTATGEIAVKFLPTIEKIVPIIQEDVVPAVGEFADTIGDLIDGYEDLNPAAKLTVQTIAGMILVAGPTISLLGKGIALYGTLQASMGALTVIKASSTAATVANTTAVVAETTAVTSLAAAEGTATVAGTGLAAVLGPITLIAAATVAIIAGSKYIIESNFWKITGGDIDACAASAEKLAASQANLDASTSALKEKIGQVQVSFASLSETTGTSVSDIENYSSALDSAESKMSEWDGGIADAQARLSELAQQVSEESREYTEEEKAEITALIGTIEEYTKEKEKLYETHLQSLNAIAEFEKNMSEETMIEYNRQAEEGYKELQKIADAAYADSVEAAIEKYGKDGTLNRGAYEAAILLAQQERDEKLAAAKASAEEVMKTTAETYANQHLTGLDYIEKLTYLKNEEKRIKEERNAAIVKANNDLKETEAFQNADSITQWQMICAEEARINEEYDQKIVDADADLAEAQTGSQADQAAALVALVQSMADSNIKIDQNTLDAVNAYLESMGMAKIDAVDTAKALNKDINAEFDGTYDNFYKIGQSAVDALIAGMQSGEDALSTQAERVEKIARKKAEKTSTSSTYSTSGVSVNPATSAAFNASGSALSAVSSSSVVNNSRVEGSTTVNMAGAVFNVRSDQDISRISKALAREIVSQRKAVGA